jgi:hypothetical protein
MTVLTVPHTKGREEAGWLTYVIYPQVRQTDNISSSFSIAMFVSPDKEISCYVLFLGHYHIKDDPLLAPLF